MRVQPGAVLALALAVLLAGSLVAQRWERAATAPGPDDGQPAAATAEPPARAAAVAAEPSRLGRRTGFSPGAGLQYADRADLERELDLVVASGATWLRLDVDWSVVEPQRGQRDWSRPDRVVDAARDRGLDVLALLAYTPSWARPDGSSTHHPPADPALFADFAGAAAARYADRGVRIYEVWNEPNLPQFWEPAPDADAYVALLVPAAAAIRAAAPGALVLSGGLAPASDGADGGRQIDPRTFLDQIYAAGAADAFDAVAVHPYSFPLLPSDTSEDYNTFQKLSALRATMVNNADADKQVWLTEIGAPTGTAERAVSEQLQADIVVDAVRAADALPWTGPVFLYAPRDAGNDADDPEDRFGLLRRDFTPKRAWGALMGLLRTAPAPTATPGD